MREKKYLKLGFNFLLLLILLLAVYFRFVGIYWGEEQYLHPDERFLVWVGSDISPVKNLSEYFDTANSSLNPHNRGHGFFVYGTLPLFAARYLVEWIFGHSGFNEMTLVGRPLSAVADLLTLLLVYFIGKRLYHKRIGLLAAAFYACSVLPIQLSHFYKEDTFTNLFTFLAIYFAVCAFDSPWNTQKHNNPRDATTPEIDREISVSKESLEGGVSSKRLGLGHTIRNYLYSPLFVNCIGFGIALGSATASKLTAVPVAMILPGSLALRLYFKKRSSDGKTHWRFNFWQAVLFLALAAVTSILVFRVLQPYAFSGSGFFGLKPNPQWIANIREQRSQSTGDVDFPPALQWARRSKLFAFNNLVLWGFGLPLGLLSWLGFLWVGWRIARGDWMRHIILWSWTLFYLLWQSITHNPTMRYLLPIYPALTIFASWFILELFEQRNRTAHLLTNTHQSFVNFVSKHWNRLLAIMIGILVLGATVCWAYAFTRIYTRPITRVDASRWIYQNVPGPINLHIQGIEGFYNQPLPFPDNLTVNSALPYSTFFNAKSTGTINEIYFPHILDLNSSPGVKNLEIIVKNGADDSVESKTILSDDFFPIDDPRGKGYTAYLDKPIQVEKGKSYHLNILVLGGNGDLTFFGSAPANESTWDDGLPLRIDGYDGYGGIYRSGLVFEMYWDDNTEKLLRFLNTLEQADFVFISSNRQWGTTTRVPERYPLTSAFYRHLIGCPPSKEIIWCYDVANAGTFQSDLGFNLVRIFESDPTIGKIRINDQYAEEAFTVYDHPKVFIFQKTSQFDMQKVSDILGMVDLTKVIHVTPRQATSYPGNLMLPSARWEEQKSNGTWSNLFDTNSLINRNQLVSTILWYLSISLLGWIAYPTIRLALSGLSDRGYPFGRIVGLLMVSYLVWLAGSLRIPFTRLTISFVVAVFVLVNVILAYFHFGEIVQEWKDRKRYFLLIETIFVIFFVVDLLIRIGNPDLWHPWKGGEKPMDFAYFNAVLKSSSFPSYDPWFAGGYLNYYYYGFVLMGVWVKWLGLVPSIAYNLIIPTVFAMIALGAFSISWNLFAVNKERGFSRKFSDLRIGIGMAGALGMSTLGNLGIVQMLFRGYQRVAAPGGVIEGVGILTHWVWAVRGFFMVLAGSSLPYGIGDWYWNPSRVIPAPNEVEPITEFPFFTVLYADLHAHLFALPLGLLVLAFALSVIRMNIKFSNKTIPTFVLGGLAMGVLRPTNTWDFYTYLCIGLLAVGYAFWTASKEPHEFGGLGTQLSLARRIKIDQRIIKSLLGILLLIILSLALFLPYIKWYGPGYNQVELWKGTHTSTTAYLTHWGLFLFVIISWMIWESIDWMASTPVSALRKLKPYRNAIYFFAAMLIMSVVGLTALYKVYIAWFVLPMIVLTGILILRPEQDIAKRFVLFLIGTGLTLTLMVEIIVLRGDIARMNTVFKFYLQVWTLFSISAAGCLGWLLPELIKWKKGWRKIWGITFALLVFAAALYPFVAGLAKIKDRMVTEAPHTLDGMLYMNYASYRDTWGEMDLSQDYRAIRWMQENVVATPVIVEANLRDLYRWGSRFSIYTGLPGVVGWEWHQQQQRARLPSNWVNDRINEVDEFYTTSDYHIAVNFLRKYAVKYIVLGQQERGHYPGFGLDKFAAANGILWQEVYHDSQTSIYEVKSNYFEF